MKENNLNNINPNFNNLNNNFNINALNPFNFPFFLPNLNIINNTKNSLSKNIVLDTEEMNKPLKDRTFFYREEVLKEGEDEYIEFKNYIHPFSQEKIEEIKKQYCGFLNCQGGRIYLGITDQKVVKGMQLDYKGRDTIRNELINYTYDFFPKCRINQLINIYFIPIKSMQNNKIINNLNVIKIIILPGEPYHLYSITNKGGYTSMIRLPGQCLKLTAEEIFSEIIRRQELFKEKIRNNGNTNMENINKKNKETKNEENTEENDENFEENEESDDTTTENGENKNTKIVYVVKISNIDTSLKIKDINKFFNGFGNGYQKFPATKDGNSEGFGEMHFSKKERAKSIIEKLNKTNLCGKKQIIMRLIKRRVPK